MPIYSPDQRSVYQWLIDGHVGHPPRPMTQQMGRGRQLGAISPLMRQFGCVTVEDASLSLARGGRGGGRGGGG